MSLLIVDVLTAAQRRLNMSRIKGKNTKPELLLRRALHARGFRFRLHTKELPGRPDLVFRRWRTIAFVHGCFWHGHSCPMFKLPSTRSAFWQSKIAGNRDRDNRAVQALTAAGWRVLIVWECGLRGPARLPEAEVLARCDGFLRDKHAARMDLTGAWETRATTNGLEAVSSGNANCNP